MRFLTTVLTCSLALARVVAAPPEKAPEGAATDVAEEDEKNSGGRQDSGIDRYRTITDRMPFGREPAGFDPDSPGSVSAAAASAEGAAAAEAARTEEEQRLIASVRVSALNVTPSGRIAVGFVDASKQPETVYYLKVGDSLDGWKVEDADLEAQSVKLSHGGVEATVKLGESSGDGKEEKGGRGRPLRRGFPHRNLQTARESDDSEQAPRPGSAMAELRRQRAQKEAAAAREAADRRAAEEAARRERAEAAAERQQQLNQLLEIQQELRLQREEKEAREAAERANRQQRGEGQAEVE